MMSSFGSGRPRGLGGDKVEYSRSIDVNKLHKAECLRSGWAGGWQWTRNGESVASINLRAEADRLHLSYRVCIGGDEWEDVAETVHIVRIPYRLALVHQGRCSTMLSVQLRSPEAFQAPRRSPPPHPARPLPRHQLASL